MFALPLGVFDRPFSVIVDIPDYLLYLGKAVFRDCGVSRPASILHKSIAGRYRPVRVADGPITARYRFI